MPVAAVHVVMVNSPPSCAPAASEMLTAALPRVSAAEVRLKRFPSEAHVISNAPSIEAPDTATTAMPLLPVSVATGRGHARDGADRVGVRVDERVAAAERVGDTETAEQNKVAHTARAAIRSMARLRARV